MHLQVDAPEGMRPGPQCAPAADAAGAPSAWIDRGTLVLLVTLTATVGFLKVIAPQTILLFDLRLAANAALVAGVVQVLLAVAALPRGSRRFATHACLAMYVLLLVNECFWPSDSCGCLGSLAHFERGGKLFLLTGLLLISHHQARIARRTVRQA